MYIYNIYEAAAPSILNLSLLLLLLRNKKIKIGNRRDKMKISAENLQEILRNA